MITLILFCGFKKNGRYITWVMVLHGIEYQRPTSLNMRILADHVTYSFLAFMKSIFHFCLGCYCGGILRTGVLICLVAIDSIKTATHEKNKVRNSYTTKNGTIQPSSFTSPKTTISIIGVNEAETKCSKILRESEDKREPLYSHGWLQFLHEQADTSIIKWEVKITCPFPKLIRCSRGSLGMDK